MGHAPAAAARPAFSRAPLPAAAGRAPRVTAPFAPRGARSLATPRAAGEGHGHQQHAVALKRQQQQQQHRHAHDLHHAGAHAHAAAPPRSSASDDSSRIIMLLSLSLALLLLPWASRHPEFLVAPLLLAVTPVVGNGVRPVLREMSAGLLATLRLSVGLLSHPEGHALQQGHHHSHGHHHGHHHGQGQHQPQLQQQPPPQQQQLQPQQPQQQQQPQQPQPHPAGPYSPWPNPSSAPAPWPSAAPAAAAAAAISAARDDADGDWSPSSPPDPHHGDPASTRHLQVVLEADTRVERELGLRGSARPAPGGRSPGGSPGASLDGAQAGEPQYAQFAGHGHGHHVRDPRVLSREAKQQLYQHHPNHNAGPAVQQQQQLSDQ